MHCVGGQQLVSVILVTVLITLFCFKLFRYLFALFSYVHEISMRDECVVCVLMGFEQCCIKTDTNT